jgi:hypothetical protein
MNKLNKISTKYPEIFKEKISISCGDGWYWLIDNLCRQINDYVKYNNNPKLFSVDKVMGMKIDQPKLDVNITYIKEKFGILNVYCDGADSEIWNYISFACNLSTKICENCGSTKYMGTTSAWIRHLCVECGEKDKNIWTPDDGVEQEIRRDKLLKIDENDKG